jgi:hypothetical protein
MFCLNKKIVTGMSQNHVEFQNVLLRMPEVRKAAELVWSDDAACEKGTVRHSRTFHQ